MNINKEIIPHFSTLVSESVYLEQKEELHKLQNVYVISDNFQLYRYLKTSAGYTFLKEGDSMAAMMPKQVASFPSLLVERFDHLPGGKVPILLLSKILSFFMFIAERGRDEAIAHILWNSITKEYEVGVPTQLVSKASANYKFDDVEPHHVIIVDIHSHNYMGSFWSGTDDRDDTRGVWYSGVFGDIGRVPSCNWRFTSLGAFRPSKHEDIFQEPFTEVNLKEDFPEVWKGKVTIHQPVVLERTRNGYGYSLGRGLDNVDEPRWPRWDRGMSTPKASYGFPDGLLFVPRSKEAIIRSDFYDALYDVQELLSDAETRAALRVDKDGYSTHVGKTLAPLVKMLPVSSVVTLADGLLRFLSKVKSEIPSRRKKSLLKRLLETAEVLSNDSE